MDKADNSLVESGVGLPHSYRQSRSGNSTGAADKQKVTDQNSLSESEQHPVALGLVRLQEAKGEKKCGSTASKADGAPCCSFLVFLCLQPLVDCLQEEPAWLREAGIKQISQRYCRSDLILRAALQHQPAFSPLPCKSFT